MENKKTIKSWDLSYDIVLNKSNYDSTYHPYLMYEAFHDSVEFNIQKGSATYKKVKDFLSFHQEWKSTNDPYLSSKNIIDLAESLVLSDSKWLFVYRYNEHTDMLSIQEGKHRIKALNWLVENKLITDETEVLSVFSGQQKNTYDLLFPVELENVVLDPYIDKHNKVLFNQTWYYVTKDVPGRQLAIYYHRLIYGPLYSNNPDFVNHKKHQFDFIKFKWNKNKEAVLEYTKQQNQVYMPYEEGIDIYNQYYVDNIHWLYQEKKLRYVPLYTMENIVPVWTPPNLNKFISVKNVFDLAESLIINNTVWMFGDKVREDGKRSVREGRHRFAALKLLEKIGAITSRTKILSIEEVPHQRYTWLFPINTQYHHRLNLKDLSFQEVITWNNQKYAVQKNSSYEETTLYYHWCALHKIINHDSFYIDANPKIDIISFDFVISRDDALEKLNSFRNQIIDSYKKDSYNTKDYPYLYKHFYDFVQTSRRMKQSKQNQSLTTIKRINEIKIAWDHYPEVFNAWNNTTTPHKIAQLNFIKEQNYPFPVVLWGYRLASDLSAYIVALLQWGIKKDIIDPNIKLLCLRNESGKTPGRILCPNAIPLNTYIQNYEGIKTCPLVQKNDLNFIELKPYHYIIMLNTTYAVLQPFFQDIEFINGEKLEAIIWEN